METPENTGLSAEVVPTPEDEKIFQEIENGNFKNTYKLTAITDKIAKTLYETNYEGHLDLRNLTSLSDNAAFYISKYKGEILSLQRLIFISDKGIGYLAYSKVIVYTNSNIQDRIDKIKAK